MKTKNVRIIVSALCLIVSIVAARLWAQLPEISAEPVQRMGLFLMMGIAMFGIVFAFPFTRNKQVFLAILIGGILVRLAFVGAPLSDDVNRYLWEGKLVAAGENPYSDVADAEQWQELRDDFWEKMNHRDRLTAYPPGMEWLMAATSTIWYHPSAYRWLAILGDIASLLILAKLMIAQARPLRWLGFYAFNPVVLVSFAAEGHLDSWMVAGTLLAVWAAGEKRWGLAWVFLGVAIQMKLMVFVLGPVFLIASRGKGIWWGLPILILPSLPFFSHLGGLFNGLSGFAENSSFNAGLFELLRFARLPENVTRWILKLLFGGVVLAILYRMLRDKDREVGNKAFWILGWLLVCSPIIHFWYLTWVIPFLCLVPRLSWLALSVMMAGYFYAWAESIGGWGYPAYWTILIWTPFFLFSLFEYPSVLKRVFAKPFRLKNQSLDAVVPVYNAGDTLGEFIPKLRRTLGKEAEIIVVDGGSTDDSREIAEQASCIVVDSALGRGAQIAAGTRESKADLVAIIHADSKPTEGWTDLVKAVAQNQPRVGAWVMGQRFSSSSLGLTLVESLNEGRVMFQGTAFGDQTLIVRNELIQRIGGFPDQPLMEDVEVSLRILEESPINYLGQDWEVSATKWHGNFIKRFAMVIRFMIRYRWVRLFGLDRAKGLTVDMFEEYYAAKSK